jgi:hypothetical protein
MARHVERCFLTGPWVASTLTAVLISSLLALLSFSCGGAAREAGAAVRDSAGIRIVENPAPDPDAAPLWTVAAEPRVDIGLLEGAEPYQLSQVGGAVRLSDGRIAVANGGSQELRFFDSIGTYLATAGRKGGGPGEFEQLGPVFALPGDTVAGFDWSLRRISLFDPAGQFVRSFTLDFPAGAPVPLGRLADGAWLCNRMFTFRPAGEGTQVVRDTTALLVFDSSGAFRDSIGRFAGPEWYVRSQGNAASASSLPFGTNTEVAVGGDGFYAGQTGRYEIVRYSAAGAPELIVRRAWTPQPVTSEDVSRLKAERLARADAGFRPNLERLFQDIPFPSTFPAFADLQVDPLGDVWVLESSRPGDTRHRWTVFAPFGSVLGVVETPAGLAVRQIGRDYVLGTWHDDLDVEHVRLYDLQRQ